MLQLRHILFPTDFSDRADDVMQHAAFAARVYGADLHILHVHESSSASDVDEAEFQARLDAHARQLRDAGGEVAVNVVTVVRNGEAPAPEIIDYATEEGIDLIVIGTHGRRGVRRMFMGSVAEEVLRSAPCPVLTVRHDDAPLPQPRPPRRVLVPIDFSEFGIASLRAAKRFVDDGGEVVLVHAVEEFVPPGVYGLEYPSYHDLRADIDQHARREMEEMARSELGDAVRYRIELQTGYAPVAIVEFADEIDADLVVMSTHGRSGIERMLLGSVAERVVRTSDRPVLIVRSFPADATQS